MCVQPQLEFIEDFGTRINLIKEGFSTVTVFLELSSLFVAPLDSVLLSCIRGTIRKRRLGTKQMQLWKIDN